MVRSPWLDAIIDPAALLVLVAAVFAGLLAAWWLFPLGILLWLVMLLRNLNDPSLRLNQAIQNRKGVAQRFTTPINAIQKVQISIFNSVHSTSRSMRAVLQPVQQAVDNAVEQAYQLASRFTPMENYNQVSVSPANLEQELQRLTNLMNAAQDASVQREYEESIKSMRQRLEKNKESTSQLEKVDALLADLKNELDVVMSETLQMQTLDPAKAKELVPELVNRINLEVEQLKGVA